MSPTAFTRAPVSPAEDRIPPERQVTTSDPGVAGPVCLDPRESLIRATSAAGGLKPPRVCPSSISPENLSKSSPCRRLLKPALQHRLNFLHPVFGQSRSEGV